MRPQPLFDHLCTLSPRDLLTIYFYFSMPTRVFADGPLPARLFGSPSRKSITRRNKFFPATISILAYFLYTSKRQESQHGSCLTRPEKRRKADAPAAAPAEPKRTTSDQMDADQISDDEYDYEYEDDEDFDDDNMAAADSGGGAAGGGAGSGKGGGGGGGGASSAAEAEVDLALRDETGVAFVDQAQLKVLMSKVVSDIRYAASSSHGKRYSTTQCS